MLKECQICLAWIWSGIICDVCRNKIEIFNGYCAICIGNFCFCKDRYIALFTYDSVKDLILKLKYCGEYNIAKLFTEISDINVDNGLLWTCVPTTINKIINRGYNPSLLLTVEMAKKYGGHVNPLIFDMIEGEVEKNKDRMNRIVSGERFYIMEKITENTIVIVDDVICSGATIRKLITLLKEYNSEIRVISIFIAKR